jgi:hypothetical protein
MVVSSLVQGVRDRINSRVAFGVGDRMRFETGAAVLERRSVFGVTEDARRKPN